MGLQWVAANATLVMDAYAKGPLDIEPNLGINQVVHQDLNLN